MLPCFINFTSVRSVHETTTEALKCPSLTSITIIADGVPEQQTKDIIKDAEEKQIGIAGLATVSGIKPGCIRLGNAGGMLDNIVMSKLYRAGSVVSASMSGGMSRELNKILPGVPMDSSKVLPLVVTDALEVVFLDHMLR